MRFIIVIITSGLLTAWPLLADNWPAWRGPNGNGISQETGLPTEWNDQKNILWKFKLPGMAGSTPCCWGERIFLTSEEGKDLMLLCIDTEGKLVWKQKVAAGEGRKVRSDEGNSSSPSPSTDGEFVYVFMGTGDLCCYDFTGKQKWHVDIQKKYGRFRIQFGMHMTPVLYQDRLYLQLIHSGGAWVIAIDKKTGDEVWKVERPSDGRDECEHSYASPTIWQNDGKAFLIVHGNDYTTGHQLADGKEIWRLGQLNPKDRYNNTLRFVATPLATPELIIVPTAKNGQVVGLKPDAKGNVGPGSSFEKWRKARGTPDVPSPLYHDGLVYLCRENGVLNCLDAATGQEIYQQRMHPARYRASPIYADGKIYCTARDGTVTVVKAGRQFESLAVNKLNDQISSSPIVANGRIYLRGYDNLYAIGFK